MIKLAQEHWAKVGKGLTIVAALLGVALTAVTLAEKIPSTRVLVVFDEVDYPMNPELGTEIDRRLDANMLAVVLARWKMQSTPADAMMTELEEITQHPDKLGQQQGKSILSVLELRYGRLFVAEVKNESDEVVHEVEIALPGEGVALPEPTMLADPISWKNTLKVGPLLPGESRRVMIWPRGMMPMKCLDLRPGVTYDGGHPGKVLMARKFYGWDAELMARFLSLPAWARCLMALLLAALGIVAAVFRKRLRKTPAIPALDP